MHIEARRNNRGKAVQTQKCQIQSTKFSEDRYDIRHSLTFVLSVLKKDQLRFQVYKRIFIKMTLRK